MDIETGVELMIGRPGAGKSFAAVRRAIRVMREQRRPVYTNLPLQWRVFKTWLRNRGGEALAGLLRPLSEAHFVRFIERMRAMQEFKDALRVADPKLTPTQLTERWLEHAGPDITAGNDANWIPAYSVICMDEVHHWFPNPALRSVKKPEPLALMSYLTMHRHLLHWVWVITQDQRQISTTFKSLANRIWVIHPKDDERLAWFIRFKHLGIKAFGYLCYSPEQYALAGDTGSMTGAGEPQASYAVLPWLPWERFHFRLYRAFTHAGSRRELRAGLKAARLESGLDEKGRLQSEVEPMAARSRFGVFAMFGCLGKILVVLLVLLVVLSVGMWAGSKSSAPSGESVALDAEGKPIVVDKVAIDRAVKCVGLSPAGVRMATGDVVTIGGQYRGLELASFDVGHGLSVWNDLERGDVWVWEVGQVGRRLGSISEVTGAIQRLQSRRAFLNGQGPGSTGAGGVESP